MPTSFVIVWHTSLPNEAGAHDIRPVTYPTSRDYFEWVGERRGEGVETGTL